MKKIIIVIGLLGVLFIFFSSAVNQCYPCSTFVLKKGRHLIFGRNWDHFSSKGLVVVNKRGIVKKALLVSNEEPVEWVSQYGSLTFNQIGKEFPYGGMNEKGLVVEMMWLEDTIYPEPDERPALMDVQWIQYQLDNCSTVEEVIMTQSQIRISQSLSKLHFLICDKSGDTTTIEFIDGQVVYHTGQSLPIPALTNDTYDSCIDLLKDYQGYEWEKQIDHTTLRSKDRFIKIARRIDDYNAENIESPVGYAFDMLASIGVGKVDRHRTAWSIVYDIENLQIHFKTFENRKIRIINLRDFNFACSATSKILDVSTDLEGHVSGDFIDYTEVMNKNLIETVFNIYKEAGFISNISDMQIYILANYPNSLKCKK